MSKTETTKVINNTNTMEGKQIDMVEIRQLRIALSLAGITCNDMAVVTMLKVLEKVKKLKGKFSVEDGVKIEIEVNAIFNPKTTKK
jgi:hypothetical protein